MKKIVVPKTSAASASVEYLPTIKVSPTPIRTCATCPPINGSESKNRERM